MKPIAEKTVSGTFFALVAIGIICLAVFGVCWNWGLVPIGDRPIGVGQDLLGSYAAGELVREGRGSAMYDRGTVAATEARIMRQSGITGDARYLPWMNPPFAALPFAPLSALPYRTAARVWLAVNIALVGISLLLLGDLVPVALSPRHTLLLWLAVCLSMPFWQAMLAQQNTFVSLTLLCLLCGFWIKGRGFSAGVCAGLMLFKPQLAVVIAGVLCVSCGLPAIAGFAIAAGGLLVLTLIALPGALSACRQHLPATVYWLQMELPYNWGRQITLQSFWRLAIQGHAVGPMGIAARGLWAIGAAIVGAAVLLAAWRCRQGKVSTRRLIAATIAATPLIVPYYMDYDLLLLAVAAAIALAEKPAGNRWLPLGWIGVYVALFINPFAAAEGRWNLAVLAVAIAAVQALRQCYAADPALAVGRISPPPRALAA